MTKGRTVASGATATTAKEWRKVSTEGELFCLPSGRIARLRRPSLFALVAGIGYVPHQLSQEVMSFLAERDGISEKSPDEQVEDYKKNARAYVSLAHLAFVEPRINISGPPDYEAGEISPLDLTVRDYLFVYAENFYGSEDDLVRFRPVTGV